MPRSVVDLSQLNALDAAIKAYNGNTDAAMAAFQRSVSDLLVQFESKLNELERIREQRLAALNRCEYHRSIDNSISCAAQESAYYAAEARCRRCEALVREAHMAVTEYRNYADRFRSTKSDLCSRAAAGLLRVEDIVNEYLSNLTPDTETVISSGVSNPSPMSSQTNKQDYDPVTGGGSFVYIRGGEQIEQVLPKGSATDPVRIDNDAHQLEQFPPVSAPDKSTMRVAASGILAAIAAGGLVIGGREMLLQQKTDEIFESQYGISRTELLLKSGPKQKEYVAAYNNIYKGLQQEMKEIKKEEVSNQIQKSKEFLSLEERRIKELRGEVTLFSIEQVHDKKIELANYENQLATLEDGKRRASIPLGKTKIGGLSEAGLSYMAVGMGTKEQFITVSNLLGNSQAILTGDTGKEYVFQNGEADIFFVSHDGSYVNRYMRDFSQGFSNVEKNINLPELNVTGYPEKASDCEMTWLSVSAEQKYKDAGVRVTTKRYWINNDGSARTEIIAASLGGEAKGGVSLSPTGAEIGVEVSAARAGAKVTYITAPNLKKGYYNQIEYGASGEANLGVALSAGTSKTQDGTNELGFKIPFAKASVVYSKFNLSEKVFPESIRKQLK